MGRPRAFDEDEAVQAAAALFAARGYEGTSVDDLVTGLGVHRGSLYKVFGSKRGLYLVALRRHLDHEVLPFADGLADAPDLPALLARAAVGWDGGPAAGLLVGAAVERAAVDPEVAALVEEGTTALDRVLDRFPGAGPAAVALSAAVLGLRLRARAGIPVPEPAVRALAGPGGTPHGGPAAPHRPAPAADGTRDTRDTHANREN